MLLERCTWREVEAYLETSKGILLPVGSTEQHGPNGLIGTDAICAELIAGLCRTPEMRHGNSLPRARLCDLLGHADGDLRSSARRERPSRLQRGAAVESRTISTGAAGRDEASHSTAATACAASPSTSRRTVVSAGV